MTDPAGVTCGAASEINDVGLAAPLSDPSGAAAGEGGPHWHLAAWSAPGAWSARRADGSRPGPSGLPDPGGPEGDVYERTDRNARSSSRALDATSGAHATGHPEPVRASLPAAEPTSSSAAGATGAPGAPPPRRRPIGAALETAPRADGPSVLARRSEQELLRAQIRELDRRLTRLDLLIRLLEADVERNHLSLSALGAARARSALPPRRADPAGLAATGREQRAGARPPATTENGRSR